MGVECRGVGWGVSGAKCLEEGRVRRCVHNIFHLHVERFIITSWLMEV